MSGHTSTWFWDTPEGGGWVRYWKGEFITDSGNGWDRFFERHPHLAEQRNAILENWPGKREPTTAERRAWRKIDPPAEGQEEEE